MSALKKLNKVSPSPTAEGRDGKIGKVTSIMHTQSWSPRQSHCTLKFAC